MIRWYDWVAAVLVADVVLTALLVLTAPVDAITISAKIFFGILGVAILELWTAYCYFRASKEKR
jgi:hypothetical protein